MERASGRSYTGGPLSKVAQKVLAALQAQSRPQARRRQSSSGDHSQMERYDSSQWEASRWNYEARFADGPLSRPRVSSHSTSHCRSSTEQQSAQTSACYQYWQTPASSLSSQPPSSSSCCRDLSPQRQTSRAEAHYQSSQTRPFRRCSASQPPSFSQGEAASSFCHGDGAPLSLPTPRTTLLHEAASWRNFAEDVTPSFTVNTSPDEDSPDEMIHITNPHLSHDEDPFITRHPVTSTLGVYNETDGNAHKEKTSDNWNFHRNGLNHIVASGSQLKRKQSLDASYEKAHCPGGLHLYPSSFATRQEYSYDPCSTKLKRHTTQSALVEPIVDLQPRTVAGSGQLLNRQHVNMFGRHTAGKKLGNVEQKDHGPDHKIVLMGLDCDSPGNSPIFPQRGHQRISVCHAADRHERAEMDHLRGQCEPITSDQGGSSHDDLARERVMELRSENETQNKTKMGTDTFTDHKIEAVNLQSSDANLKPCETNDREAAEFPSRDTDPGEKKEDAEPPVNSETKRKCPEDSGRANRPTPALSRESRRSRFKPSRLRGNQQITSGRTRGRSSNLPATTTSAPERNSSTVPNKKLGNINVPAPENQCCHLSLNSTSSLKRRHGASPPSNIGLTAKSSRGFHAEGHAREPQTTAAALTCDPRVKDSGKLNSYEKTLLLEKAGRVQALLLTVVYRDGTTQLDAEQKLPPPACGLLVLMKSHLTFGVPRDSPAPDDSLVYLKLELTPAWAQQQMHQSQQLYTRDLLLQVLSSSQLVVCYKAKDLLRTVLQFYTKDLSWTKVAGCRIQDPQVSGWLLDPADSSSCFQDLLNKHCKQPHRTPAVGTQKVSQVISGLYSLFSLHMELSSRLQSQGLWELYSDLELNMIPVLAAMESHHIHVDKDALKRTSDLLGTKMKQLEQEAHREAGQMFLVTSSSQLRMYVYLGVPCACFNVPNLHCSKVLFEKLRLHERCENKRLPKTINKQQQSTSEAALLQLQDLHPLPKIILEYRQLHKIKSTFVDGILSCMTNKNYISSTWLQTSAVTGRISAKHPNFQALPRQPVQITKKQHVQGKEAEVVTIHPRSMFIPPEGWSFLAADFCQVELRLLAHLSADPELLRIFTSPQADVFTMLASQWKGVSEDEVTTKDREHAKRIVYSVVYGAGRERLSEILGVSIEQAAQFQDSFLQTYREVQAFIQKTIQQSRKQGYALSIMGRRRALPNISCPVWGVRMQAERQAVNFVVQGSAADLCKTAMIRIFNLVSSSGSLSARLIAQLHDELLFEVEDSQVERFAALVKRTMESLQHIHHLGVHLKVPLKVAVSSGKSWGSMSKLSILSP